MEGKYCHIFEALDDYEKFNQLVERGRQLHNQAVFELFARMISNVALFVKRNNCIKRSMSHWA